MHAKICKGSTINDLGGAEENSKRKIFFPRDCLRENFFSYRRAIKKNFFPEKRHQKNFFSISSGPAPRSLMVDP